MDIVALLSKLAENGTYGVLLVIALGGLYWMFVLYKEAKDAVVQAERDHATKIEAVFKEHVASYQVQLEKSIQLTQELKNAMINQTELLKLLVAK